MSFLPLTQKVMAMLIGLLEAWLSPRGFLTHSIWQDLSASNLYCQVGLFVP